MSTEPETIAAERLAKLREALESIFKLIDDGDLVRNIEDDADIVHFAKQAARIVQTLKEARAALGQPAPESKAKCAERKQGKYRLVYNKATKRIDKVRNFDGLAVESFDPPEDYTK